MPQSWPYVGVNMQWDVDNRSAYDVLADAEAGGTTLGTLWYSELPQLMANVGSTDLGPARWASRLPNVKVHRFFFNQWSFRDKWNGDGTVQNHMIGANGGNSASQLINRMNAQGCEYLWVLADGPSQRTGQGEPGAGTYWTSYPTPVTAADWKDPAVWSLIHAGQLAAVNALANSLKTDPDMIVALGQTIGFEAMNEPNTYRQCEVVTGDTVFAVTQYVDHVLGVFDALESALPGMGFDFYVNGWRYAADLDTLHNTSLPTYGGKSAMQAIRDHVGQPRLVWSMHAYMSWLAETNRVDAVFANWSRIVKRALDAGDRAAITESNFQAITADDIHNPTRTPFVASRTMEWFRRNNVSFFWWPLVNWAQGRVLSGAGSLNAVNAHQNALAAFYRIATYNNNPDYMIGADTGMKAPAAVVPVAKNESVETDPGYNDRPDHSDLTTNYALSYGGRGVAVCTPDETANNYMFGGNGRNILIGSAGNRDFLNLGRGGGVIRMGNGYTRANIFEGNNLVYTGTGWGQVTGLTGQMTVVVDPEGETTLIGFSPRKGDKLSFKGAFADAAAMGAAMTTTAPAGAYQESHIAIAFPAGGSLTIWDCAHNAGSLALHVMDFTEGWYGAGWTEPPDYVPADFLLPIVDPPPPWPAPNASGGMGYFKGGAVVMPFTKSGVQIAPRWRSDAIMAA